MVHRNLYTTHQRIAKTFRAGRVLLAGDAAHVNNPIGGMGLNGGLQDAGCLAEKLAQVMLGGGPEALLDVYDLRRRAVACEFVQQQSIANKKRLEERDPDTRQRNLDELRATAADPCACATVPARYRDDHQPAACGRADTGRRRPGARRTLSMRPTGIAAHGRSAQALACANA